LKICLSVRYPMGNLFGGNRENEIPFMSFLKASNNSFSLQPGILTLVEKLCMLLNVRGLPLKLMSRYIFLLLQQRYQFITFAMIFLHNVFSLNYDKLSIRETSL
jgi:hypothetical protein